MKLINRCRCGNDFMYGVPAFLLCHDLPEEFKYRDEITVKELFEEVKLGYYVGECGSCGHVFQIKRALFPEGGIC